jgi:hypothetical protein
MQSVLIDTKRQNQDNKFAALSKSGYTEQVKKLAEKIQTSGKFLTSKFVLRPTKTQSDEPVRTDSPSSVHDDEWAAMRSSDQCGDICCVPY